MKKKVGLTEVRKGKQSGWLAFADIYGFKHYVLSRNLDKVAAVVDKIHKWVEIENNDNLEIFMFSDAIFIFSPAVDGIFPSLTKLNALLIRLQDFAIALGVVYRGSVAFGNVFLANKICIGQPLIEAYSLEQTLAIPGIYLPFKIVKKVNDEDLSKGTKDWYLHDIPTKDGLFLGYALLPIPPDNLMQQVRSLVKASVVDGPTYVAAVWKRYQAFLSEIIEQEPTHA